MPNLSTFSTINERVRKYMVDRSLASPGKAFERLALEAILGLNEDETEDAITDGPMDGGVDAIHISGRDIHVFNFKYSENFGNTRNAFPDTELDKLIVTIDRINAKSVGSADVNDALWEKIATIWDLFQEGPLSFKFYVCSNLQKPVEHARRKLELALNKYRYVEYFYYDQEDIVTKILEKKYRTVDGEIHFIDRQYFDRSDGPLKGIVATVAAVDLVNLVKDPNDPSKIREDAFNENVRVFLKLKNTINQSIYETALSPDNFKFWYLNNGITIVCDECSYMPNTRAPLVKLTNLQVVNGGQTTHALFEAYLQDKEKIEDVLLLVRICETKKDYGISEKISETTNRQNPIRTRDLRSNDQIQRKLEEQFLDLGYFYERKKNQFQDKPGNRRLDNELLGQLCLAYYLDMPSEARDQKAVVFADKYDTIFDENVTAAKMLLPYRIYLPLERMKRVIQEKKRRKEAIDENEAFISRATFHILNAVGLIAGKETVDLSDEDEIDKTIHKAISYVSEVVETESQKRGQVYTHDKFFKEIPTNRLIREYVLRKYDE